MDANIIRAARTIINVTDLDRAREFYVDALGFIETESDEEHLYLRGLEEFHHHSLVLKKAPNPGVHGLGLKVEKHSDLEALSLYFEKANLPVQWLAKGEQHALGETVRVQDPSGIPLEFYYEMQTVERSLQRYEQYRGARIQRIDHFNCMVPDVEAAHHFYINDMGFRCSEYTTAADDKVWATWLHRKPTVHDIAFMNGAGPRLHHVGYCVSEPSNILHICDVLASLGYGSSIERGPGRHGLSNAFFLYLRDPDGNRIELYTGDYFTGDPDFKPIRWDLNDPKRQTLWGQTAPDSWFAETMPFLDIQTGKPIQTSEAAIAQKKPNFTK